MTPDRSIKISDDVLFIDTAKVCKRCGLATCQYYLNGEDGYICPQCKFELNPPVMFLQIVQNNMFPQGKLYSPANKTYETTMRLEDFITCGWFIRERIVYEERSVVNVANFTTSVKEIIRLEYFGDRKCNRVPRYGFWMYDSKICKSIYCDRFHSWY